MQEDAMFLWESVLSMSQGHMNPHRDLENRFTEIQFPTFWFLQYDRIRPLKRVTWQFRQAMSRPTLTNLSKSNWIGNFSTVNNVFATWSSSKIKTIEDAKSIPSLLGSVGAGSIDAQLPNAVNALIGTQFKVVLGYAGSPNVILAMKRGEVDGKVNGWSSFKAEVPNQERKDLRVILQLGLAKDPELPDVPLLIDMVQGDPRKEAIVRFITLSLGPSRALAAPPNVPQPRISILRRAFDRTMADPDFLADSAKTGFDVGPMTGEAVQQLVEQMMSTQKDIIAETKSVMESTTR